MKLDRLYEQLSEDFAESVYVVERTEDGLDVTVNVVDAEYYGILYKKGVKHIVAYHMAVDEQDDTYTITDDVYRVTWQRGVTFEGGVPMIVLSSERSRKLGTFKSYSRRQTWAWNEEGRFGKVVDYEFSSEHARTRIQERAQELGLEQRMNTPAKVGLAFGIGGVVIAILALVFALSVI